MIALLALLIGAAAPPAAYVDTGSAHVPLAITSWCWDSRCGAPLGRSTRPAIVHRGSTVHLEVKFEPLDASVTVAGGPAHASTHAREVTWSATHTGGISAYVKYRRGWVIYSGRLVLR